MTNFEIRKPSEFGSVTTLSVDFDEGMIGIALETRSKDNLDDNNEADAFSYIQLDQHEINELSAILSAMSYRYGEQIYPSPH